MKIGKSTYSTTASIQFGVAAFLLLVGLWLGWAAWSDYRVYGNFQAALRAQAANRPADVLPALEGILRSRPSFPYPALLAAKRKVDDGTPTALKEALELYDWAAENGHTGGMVALGRAAAHLRTADHASSAGEQTAALDAAAKPLGEAKDWIEARILEGHILLRRAALSKNPAASPHAAQAQKVLQAAFDDAQNGKALVCQDPLVDLYVGLGVAASWSGKYQVAARMFRAARHLAPRARVPYLNAVYALARRYAEEPVVLDDLLREYDDLLDRARSVWKSDYDRDAVTYRGLDRAAFNFLLGVGWAFAKNGRVDPSAVNAFGDAKDTYSSGTDADRARCEAATAAGYQLMAKGAPAEQKPAYRNLQRRRLELAAGPLEDPELKARVLNNIAVLDVDPALRGRDPTDDELRQAREMLQQAAELAAKDARGKRTQAVALRNLGALHARAGGDAAKAREALEKSLKLDATGPGQDEVKAALDRLGTGAPPEGGAQ